MPLRNFGLSFSRRSARPNADISWRPRHAVGIGLVLVLVLLAALWAMLAHAQSEAGACQAPRAALVPLAVPPLSRFAARAGFVTWRQRFVRWCQNSVAGRFGRPGALRLQRAACNRPGVVA
jgi:hypothetical protein